MHAVSGRLVRPLTMSLQLGFARREPAVSFVLSVRFLIGVRTPVGTLHGLHGSRRIASRKHGTETSEVIL